MTEEQLHEAITGAATAYGWRWHHIRRSDAAVSQGHPGFPDLVLLRRDAILVIETKAEGGRYQPGQREWLDAFGRAGAYALVARPSDEDRVLEILR
jgi:hypothetical protein